MKKSAIIFVSICFIVITISCKKDGQCRTPIAKGTIQEQGYTTYMYGTHVLKDNKGQTTYALKSETINLDNYIGKYVEIQGKKTNPGLGGPDLIDVTEVR